jgi:hypothetical protein
MNHTDAGTIPIVISILALLVSLLSLYYSQVRGAKLRLVAGEHLNINHFVEGNVGVSLPVSLINEGVRPATLRRVGLTISIKGKVEGELLEPFYFQRIDDKGNFLQESMPTPITVAASQSVVKQVLFRSDFNHPAEFHLVNPGTYELVLLGWTEDSFVPSVKDKFDIEISEEDASQLRQYLASKTLLTIRISQFAWRKWRAHHLTEAEIQDL